jgi:hypothetical protein
MSFMPNAGELKVYCDGVAARRDRIQRLGALPAPDFNRPRLPPPPPRRAIWRPFSCRPVQTRDMPRCRVVENRRPIRSQSELLDAIRARRDELNISHETIDNIAGFQAGYTSKLLCTPPMKNPGPMSLGALLGALGMALMPVPDPEMIAKVEDRWEPRKRPQKLPVLAVGLSMQNEVPAHVAGDTRIDRKRMEREGTYENVGQAWRIEGRHQRAENVAPGQ